MIKEENCIFCKIVRGEIPTEKIWEDENFMAFPDVHPRVKGHSLVIPKKHFETVMDLDKETSEQYVNAIQQTAKIILEKYEADGFNVAVNNGKSAGQIVNHVHFHILPRKTGDHDKGLYLG